ncbi:nuclear envelope integral membrane protein 1 [Gadus chalcogrammus]|uniref:nuclear envelope integral membrane protein 1 n=1 Tax=Gadus chalcogrammus TaxID=1042646 RepID=UPI0024C3238A|nr:nuclear envelope integral membrane protein 1 [Gadus chalcogrammus]
MAGHMKKTSRVLASSAHLFVFVILVFSLPPNLCQDASTKPRIISIQNGKELVKSGTNHFCYTNQRVPDWRQTWTSIQVRVWSSQQLKVTVAEDEETLQEMDGLNFWGLVQRFISEQSNDTTLAISLFSMKTCFKIAPSDEASSYTVKAICRFDIYLFLVFLAGLLLFFFADSLSRSQIFYYSAGMSTGMIASLAIVIFILARILPRKSPFYVLLVGGWSFSVYAIQLVFRNLKPILQEHWHLAFGYMAVVGFISFAVCYRHGPLVEERSINILTWTLQLFGLLLVYAGIQIQQVALAIIVSAFCAKNMEYPVVFALAAWRKLGLSHRIRWKREPRRLLTEEQYQRQGEEETQKALEELRRYCASPECSTWKAVSRIQSPKRFADFVEGLSHLRPNEVAVHAQEYGFGGSFLEDELFDSDEEEEDPDERTFSRRL